MVEIAAAPKPEIKMPDGRRRRRTNPANARRRLPERKLPELPARELPELPADPTGQTGGGITPLEDGPYGPYIH